MTDRHHILDWTIRMTREAGELALRLFHEGAQVERKADTTLVTNIDRTVESFIRDEIGREFPGHNMYGEEEGLDEGVSPDAPLWAIDPVDGTANMAHGLPIWCVSVGLVENGVPTVGAIYAPMLRELHAGARGIGATLNGQPLPVLPEGGELDTEDLYACCSTSTRRVDFTRMKGRPRIPGSAALNLCWTADGRFAGGQGMGTDLYDVAAGICIANEVGCATRWLSNGAEWEPKDMIEGGRRPDALITATPARLEYLFRVLSYRP